MYFYVYSILRACYNFILLIDDDDEKWKKDENGYMVERLVQSLPCERYRISLKGMAQRDVLIFSS